jgi:RNA 2',3'-cyclic 3'-phosphodiesterase
MATGTDRPAGKAGAMDRAVVRAFFALWPDEPAADLIAAVARDIVRRAGGRAPRAENHHLTLAFVGDVPQARIAALERVGASAARSVTPFTLKLDRLGAFHHAGIAWLGTDRLPTPLSLLVSALREGLAANDFPFERRPYRAHVTLARHCGPVAAAAIEPVTWRVALMTLNASKLSPSGSSYRELSQWPLG